MKIDRDLVVKVADLAHLKLSEQEISHYETQLSKIFAFIEQINNLQSHLPKDWQWDLERSQTPERADEVRASLPIDLVMKEAPQRTGSAFQVPRIIE